jgi:hypothetical protein
MRHTHLSSAFLSAQVSLLDPPPPDPKKGKKGMAPNFSASQTKKSCWTLVIAEEIFRSPISDASGSMKTSAEPRTQKPSHDFFDPGVGRAYAQRILENESRPTG